MDDKLVMQNPRDSLIVMREQNLALEKEKKIEDRALKAKVVYSEILEKFSKQFLRNDMFNSLSPMHKKELGRLCASFCRRRIFWNWLPFAGSFGGIIFLGFTNVMNFLLLAPWLFAWFATFYQIEAYERKNGFLHFFDHIEFLFLQRKIKKAEKLEDKNR